MGMDCSRGSARSWLGSLLLAAEITVSAGLSDPLDSVDSFEIPTRLPASHVAFVPRIEKEIATRVHGETITPLLFAREFRTTRTRPGTPVLIRNYLGNKDSWAIHREKSLALGGRASGEGAGMLPDLRHLLERHGHRLTPVSYGSPLSMHTEGLPPFETGVTSIRHLILRGLVPSNRTHADRIAPPLNGDGCTIAGTEALAHDAEHGSTSTTPTAGSVKAMSKEKDGPPDPEAAKQGEEQRQQGAANILSASPDVEIHLAEGRSAYMSQHQLFHQCPDLLDSISVPTYNLGRELHPVNAWIGTRGTVTTLHSDTSDGFLCQVAGFKYVRLYGPLEEGQASHHRGTGSPGDPDGVREQARVHLDKPVPCQSDRFYASFHEEFSGGRPKRFGTSPVRIEKPDVGGEHPRFTGATYTEALLGPGDMLYIPEGHWHYIRGLTTSVSVNFW